MKTFRLCIFALVLLLFSCDGRTVYSDKDSGFKKNRWEKSDIKTYDFEIKNPDGKYDIDVFFSHVYDYQFPKIPLLAELEMPDGTIKTIAIAVNIKDENSRDVGDCSGDFCDLYQTILEGETLPKGKYSLKLQHVFNNDFLPNVLSVGIRVTESK